MSRVAEGHFRKETRSALDIEGKHVTIQGPSPDLTSSVSVLARALAGGSGPRNLGGQCGPRWHSSTISALNSG